MLLVVLRTTLAPLVGVQGTIYGTRSAFEVRLNGDVFVQGIADFSYRLTENGTR